MPSFVTWNAVLILNISDRDVRPTANHAIPAAPAAPSKGSSLHGLGSFTVALFYLNSRASIQVEWKFSISPRSQDKADHFAPWNRCGHEPWSCPGVLPASRRCTSYACQILSKIFHGQCFRAATC